MFLFLIFVLLGFSLLRLFLKASGSLVRFVSGALFVAFCIAYWPMIIGFVPGLCMLAFIGLFFSAFCIPFFVCLLLLSLVFGLFALLFKIGVFLLCLACILLCFSYWRSRAYFFASHAKKWGKDFMVSRGSCKSKTCEDRNVYFHNKKHIYRGSQENPYYIFDESIMYGKVGFDHCVIEDRITVYGKIYTDNTEFKDKLFLYGKISGTVKGDLTCTGMCTLKYLVIEGSLYLEKFAGSLKHVHIKGNLHIDEKTFSLSQKHVQVDGEVFIDGDEE